MKMQWGPVSDHYNIVEGVWRTLNPGDNSNLIKPIPLPERVRIVKEIELALINGTPCPYIKGAYQEEPGVHMALLPIAILDVTHKGQRINDEDIFSLGDAYQAKLAPSIMVSIRDGHANVTDGMHEAVGADCKGKAYISAKVLMGLTAADESRMFVQQNDNTRNIPRIEYYEKGLNHGDPRSCAIQALAARYGLTVAAGQKKGLRRPMTAITLMWDKFSEACAKDPATNVVYVTDQAKYNHYRNMYEWILNIFDESTWLDTLDSRPSKKSPEYTCRCLSTTPIDAFAHVYETILKTDGLNLETATANIINTTTRITLAQLKSRATDWRKGEDIRTSLKAYVLRIADGRFNPDDVVAHIANTGHDDCRKA